MGIPDDLEGSLDFQELEKRLANQPPSPADDQLVTPEQDWVIDLLDQLSVREKVLHELVKKLDREALEARKRFERAHAAWSGIDSARKTLINLVDFSTKPPRQRAL